MKIAVLAIQGAFIEHERVLNQMGIETVELRKRQDLFQEFDGLILPGGESTVQGKLLKELDMFDILRKKLREGLPVLATCAGLILLAETISNDTNAYFQTLPVTVKRNAYGRQLGSFRFTGELKGIGNFQMEFIRAPYIESIQDNVVILGKVDEKIVAVQYLNQIAVAFHPELGTDSKIHRHFIDLVSQYNHIQLGCEK
jgi:5'-phosphate synthase pdxT subunit